jgi:hypothetical protein
MKLRIVWVLASLAGLSAAAVACTTTSTAPGTVPDVAPTEDGADAAVDAAPKPRPDAGAQDASSGENDTCLAKANANECSNCCAEVHEEGILSGFAPAMVDCFCRGVGIAAFDGGGASPCAAVCSGTLCAAPRQGVNDACSTCLSDNAELCGQAVGARCEADARCKKWRMCNDACDDAFK